MADPLLAEDVLDIDELVPLVRDLAALPGAAGEEAARAEHLAAALAPRAAAVGIAVHVDRFAPGRANVILGPRHGADLAFVGHLDTSLGDDPHLWWRLTGRADAPGAVTCTDGVLEGLGVGVALAPTVAAALTAIEIHRRLGEARVARSVGAVLTAGGTHRAVPPGPADASGAVAGASAAGLRELERRGDLPRAAINAKGGAPGPLHVEPGSLYLAIELTDTWGPVLARAPWAGLSGAPALVGAVIDAVGEWRRSFIDARADLEPQLAADVAIGAIDAGLAAKPDLLPATARVLVHVVTLPGDEPDDVARSLADVLRAEPRLAHLAGAISVTPYGWLPAGRTPPAHALVRAADAAWRAVLGPHDVQAWRGCTDGSYLRHVGVPTVRIGPPLSSDPTDPRRERVRLDDLRYVADVWSRTASAYFAVEART